MAVVIGAPFIILAVLLFVVVVAAGIMIVTRLVEHKWGYTPEREQELQERIENAGSNGKDRRKEKDNR